MKRVTKLTPSTLKRIIAEEKQKLAKSRRSRTPRSNDKLLETYMNYLKILKSRKARNRKELKRIEEARRLLKISLLKRV